MESVDASLHVVNSKQVVIDFQVVLNAIQLQHTGMFSAPVASCDRLQPVYRPNAVNLFYL
jgi:hypothetical protein